MRRADRRFLFSVLGGAIFGIAAAIGLALAMHGWRGNESDLHAMLHDAVPLDRQEQAVLDAKEHAFARRRMAIERQMRDANGRLADAIASDPRWSPQVEAATQQVEQAAGDLQRATLVHVFEMRSGLKPEHRAAYDKVLIDALRRGSR